MQGFPIQYLIPFEQCYAELRKGSRHKGGGSELRPSSCRVGSGGSQITGMSPCSMSRCRGSSRRVRAASWIATLFCRSCAVRRSSMPCDTTRLNCKQADGGPVGRGSTVDRGGVQRVGVGWSHLLEGLGVLRAWVFRWTLLSVLEGGSVHSWGSEVPAPEVAMACINSEPAQREPRGTTRNGHSKTAQTKQDQQPSSA
jgi:hypothetical protein